MPTMANITIKKADGTTDVEWTALASSSGDNSPAVWRNNTVGTTVAERPTLSVSARANGTGTARRVNGVFHWPVSVVATDGSVTIKGDSPGSFTFLAPQNLTQTDINERAYQFGNLIAAAIIKESMAEGLAPRA